MGNTMATSEARRDSRANRPEAKIGSKLRMQSWACSIAQALLQIPADFRNSQNAVAPARGADSASQPGLTGIMTSVKMLSGSHAHMSLKKQLYPVVRIVTMRPAPFSGDALLKRTLPLADLPKMICPAKLP
jgi:hypothetical protein